MARWWALPPSSPASSNDLWEAVKAGDLKRAMAVQAAITPLKDAVYGGGEPTGEAHARMKMGMYLAGVLDSPTVRPPTEARIVAETAALRAAVAQAGLLKRRTAPGTGTAPTETPCNASISSGWRQPPHCSHSAARPWPAKPITAIIPSRPAARSTRWGACWRRNWDSSSARR